MVITVARGGLLGDLLDRINVLEIVDAHIDTLTARPGGDRVRGIDLIIFYAMPAGVAASGFAWGWQAPNAGPILAGATFLAAALLTMLFQTLTLVTHAQEEIKGALPQSWEEERARRRMQLVADNYHSVAYAFLVSLLLLGVGAIAAVATPTDESLGVMITAIIVALSLHLGLTLLLIVKRLFLAVRDTIDSADSSSSSTHETGDPVPH